MQWIQELGCADKTNKNTDSGGRKNTALQGHPFLLRLGVAWWQKLAFGKRKKCLQFFATKALFLPVFANLQQKTLFLRVFRLSLDERTLSFVQLWTLLSESGRKEAVLSCI